MFTTGKLRMALMHLWGRTAEDYWHVPMRRPSSLNRSGPADYYLDVSSKADYPGPVDPSGIPMMYDVASKSYVQNPTTIAFFGLANLARSQSDGDDRAIACAEWLVSHFQERGSYGLWIHDYPLPSYGISGPWPSAMTQGVCLSFLTRYIASSLPRSCVGERTVELAANAFLESNLIVSGLGSHRVYLEEAPNSAPTHILNGWIFGLWGLWDAWRTLHRSDLRRVLDASIATLASELARYDLGYWSRYELGGRGLPNVASLEYHLLHIEQLKVMADLCPGYGEWLEFAGKWDDYMRVWSNRFRAVVVKGLHKILRY